jgi:radical SAM protein with 4Fe4S-binding SPASM domain
MSSATTPYSQLRNFERPSLARSLPLPMPMGMFIEPTNQCNFKCRFCPESFDDYTETVGGRAYMDFALFERIVAQIRELGRLKVLRFYMLGEPLLHPDLVRMIKLAVDSGISDRTELTTNATALTEAKSRALLESGLDYLRVSIYAAHQDRNERVTQSKIPITRIYENVKTFRRLRDEAHRSQPFLYVKMIDSCSGEENQAFLDMYQPLADECVLEKPMNWNGYENRDLLGAAYTDGAEKKTLDATELYPFRKQVCPFPFYTAVINANGDVTACCVDWNKKTCIGNIKEATLGEVWRGDRAREFRRMHLEGRRHENESCRNCTYLYTSPDNLDDVPPADFARILG